MEEGLDYLSAGSGQHFAVPFDELLLFSTNLNPTQIADEAFLRRIGYKIELKACTPEQFRDIWRQVCAERDLYFDPAVLIHTLSRHYGPEGRPLLASHPRDLIGMALDWKVYEGKPADLDEEGIDWAWRNYFVRTGGSEPPARG
jgi:hypothetical protein